MAKIFKALSNEQRLKLFKMIYKDYQKLKSNEKEIGGDGCCQGLKKAFTAACCCMNISRSTISHHFKELQEAGLISCKRIGQAFECSINEDAVEAVRNFLE
jgi:ArsR family transcriptional regulator